MKHRFRWIIPLAALAACAPVDNGNADQAEPATAPVDDPIDWTGYSARGNEPFWSLSIDGERIEFDHFDRLGAQSPFSPPVRTANGWRFETAAGSGQPLILEIENTVCHDSMSGAPFPHHVAVTVDGESYTGCGGDTRNLIAGGEWRIVALAGDALPQGFEQSLGFDTDGGLSGNGGCNRYSAGYEINGPEFSISPVRSTRRACANAAWNALESRFFTLLGETTRFAIGEDGALQLYDAGDELVIAARR